MNKEPFNLKTVQNLLDMIQNRDYLIEKLEFQISDLHMDSTGDEMDRQDFIATLNEIITVLDYALHITTSSIKRDFTNLKHAAQQTIDNLRELISDNE